jgi:hypothetical protein
MIVAFVCFFGQEKPMRPNKGKVAYHSYTADTG